jgi:site-specific recombinase XerD
MLNLFRRHTPKCPHRHKGRDYIKCNCPIHVDGILENGERYRDSLKLRDWARATRKLAEKLEELEGHGAAPPPARKRHGKTLADAVKDFLARYPDPSETRRKYKRLLAYLTEYCDTRSINELMVVSDGKELDAITIEVMDGYAMWRNQKAGWSWAKEIEVLRQFFTFCVDRDWMRKNPARVLKRPRILEANDVVPYTQEEMVRIIAACDKIGLYSYERLRARAMVLLMRYEGIRISDVVTLSREHIQGNHLVKRAVKNAKLISVALHPEVQKALEALPRPKAAGTDCQLYFTSENSSLRSSVKGAQRTLWAVFKIAKVPGAHPHRFRHTLASELLAKGASYEDIAGILADSPTTVRRHYAKRTPEYQTRQDRTLALVHGANSVTNLAQTETPAVSC